MVNLNCEFDFFYSLPLFNFQKYMKIRKWTNKKLITNKIN